MNRMDDTSFFLAHELIITQLKSEKDEGKIAMLYNSLITLQRNYLLTRQLED